MIFVTLTINLNKELICFINPNKISYIDLFFFTNCPRYFQNSIYFFTYCPRYFQNVSTIEAGIYNFHKLVVTVLKMFCKKQKPKIIQYKIYKTFNEQLFRIELEKDLVKIDLKNAKLEEFYDELLNKHMLQ